MPKRVLFVAEAVTLAHVARPIALARSLDKTRFAPVFACHERAHHFFASEEGPVLPMQTVSAADFLERLAKGRPLYDVDTLRTYVAEDGELIRRVKPDGIIGDFRLSLSISARLAKIPYATVTNAYWSPFYKYRRMPLPTLPMTRWMPISMARVLFYSVQPVALAHHCAAFNRVRVENGLPAIGGDLRRCYTDADHVVYADIPSLFPTQPLPANHHQVGPLSWSPPVDSPVWWQTLPIDKPIVYVTMGSSGNIKVLRAVLDALVKLPVTVIASTAGHSIGNDIPKNAFLAPYLAGDAAASRAHLVICNGGSPTSQQALAAGVPVLGIASNMDQFLNMDGLQRAGVGMLLRADRISASQITRTALTMLESTDLRSAAQAISMQLSTNSIVDRFNRIVQRMMDD